MSAAQLFLDNPVTATSMLETIIIGDMIAHGGGGAWLGHGMGTCLFQDMNHGDALEFLWISTCSMCCNLTCSAFFIDVSLVVNVNDSAFPSYFTDHTAGILAAGKISGRYISENTIDISWGFSEKLT